MAIYFSMIHYINEIRKCEHEYDFSIYQCPKCGDRIIPIKMISMEEFRKQYPDAGE